MFPFAGEHQPALLPAVEALLDAVGLTELAEVLDGHPELLDPGADFVITQFMTVALMRDNDALTEAFGYRLRLVRLARKDGAEAALADLRSKVIADQPTELRSLWEAAVATDGRGESAVDFAPAAWSALLDHADFDQASADFQLLATDAAIGAHVRAVEAAPPHSDVLQSRLSALARLWRIRYAKTQRISDMDSGIEAYSAAVAAAPQEDPALPGLLTALAAGLRARFDYTAQPPDLDAAIEVYRRASALAPPGSPLLAQSLNDGGLALIARNSLGARQDDVDEAIDDFSRAVEASTAGSSLLADAFNNLAGGHWTRYLQQDRPEDLEAAVRAAARAVELTPASSEWLAGRLGNLAKSQGERYRTTQQYEALDAEIEAHRRQADVIPSGSPDLAQCLGHLGLALRARHERTGDLGDLEAAIAAFRRALQAAGPDMPGMPGHLTNLGTGLARRYEVGDRIGDLDEAIEAFRRAATDSPAGSPIRRKSLSNLGGVLGLRYERMGKPADLDESVRSLTEAARAPVSAPELPGVLNNLAGALTRLYHRDGRLDDLERAIEAQVRAVELTPANSPDLAGYLYGLASSRLVRHHRSEDPADLDAAIRDYQHAIESETDPLVQAAVLSDLGNALKARYPHSGNAEDLDVAIDSLTRSVEITPARAPSLARHLFQLGNGLAVRFAYRDDIADLDAAVDAFQRALGLTGESAVLRAHLLLAMGGAMLSRHGAVGRPEDLEAAVEALRAGCTVGTATASQAVLNGAQLWGASAAARQEWPEAAEAYRHALEAGERLIELEVGREHKESWLQAARELPGPAALALARSGDFEAAVVVLERWRAIMLSGALDLDRRDLDRLRSAHPQLYQRHQAMAAALREAEQRALAVADVGTPGDRPDLAAAGDSLAHPLIEIRARPGFEDFLLPPDFAEVADIADETPLAYLTAAPGGGLALLVPPGGTLRMCGYPSSPTRRWPGARGHVSASRGLPGGRVRSTASCSGCGPPRWARCWRPPLRRPQSPWCPAGYSGSCRCTRLGPTTPARSRGAGTRWTRHG